MPVPEFIGVCIGDGTVPALEGLVSVPVFGLFLYANLYSDHKPNIIFDVTLKSLSILNQLTRSVLDMGYDKKNIHIVWVVNELETALQQNQERKRKVPKEILVVDALVAIDFPYGILNVIQCYFKTFHVHI